MKRPLRVTFGPGALTLLFMTGSRWYTTWGLVLWTGVYAAIGRLAVVRRLVTTHDDMTFVRSGVKSGERHFGG